MKLYKASYYMSYGFGAYDEAHYVVVANTEKEALGLALQEELGYKSGGWSITELENHLAIAHFISSRWD